MFFTKITYAAIVMDQLGYTHEKIKKVQASTLSEIDWTDEKTAKKKSYSFK